MDFAELLAAEAGSVYTPTSHTREGPFPHVLVNTVSYTTVLISVSLVGDKCYLGVN